MRCLSALDFRTRTHITADISSRQAYRTQRANHDVRKILTDAPPMTHNIDQRRVYGSRLRVVFEIRENTMREILYRFKQRPLRHKCLLRVLVELRGGWNVRRTVDELRSLD